MIHNWNHHFNITNNLTEEIFLKNKIDIFHTNTGDALKIYFLDDHIEYLIKFLKNIQINSLSIKFNKKIKSIIMEAKI